jgi:hypothetical protein
MEESNHPDLLSNPLDFHDDLLDDAIQFVLSSGRASASAVQRHFRIGYHQAESLVIAMEVKGIVSKMQKNGNRIIILGNDTTIDEIFNEEECQEYEKKFEDAKLENAELTNQVRDANLENAKIADRLKQTRSIYVDSIHLGDVPQNWSCRCTVKNSLVISEMEAQLSNLDNSNRSLLISCQQAQALLYRFLNDYERIGFIQCEEEDINFIFEDVLNYVTFGSLILPLNDLFYDEIRKLLNLIEYQQKEPIRQLTVYSICNGDIKNENFIDYFDGIKIELKSILSEDCLLKIGITFVEESSCENDLRILFSFI